MSIADILPQIVIYHANCDDGFCAAWLHHHLSTRMGEYIAAQCGDDPPDVKGREVLIFGFSYRRDTLLKMHEQADSLLVFDHHKTAEAELDGLDFCAFDSDKSGARMALKYLEGEGAENWLVDHIGSRDFWGNPMPNNELVLTGLSSYPRDFETWDRLFKKGPAALGRLGRHIKGYHSRLVAKAVEDHSWVNIAGHIVPVATHTIARITSDIARALAEIEGVPFAAGLGVLSSGDIVWHLRSRGDFDVRELARRFGGDGHRHGASFQAALADRIEADLAMTVGPDETEG